MSSILITGGTGSFGRAFVQRLLEADLYRRVIVFSRDELKQSEMRDQGFTSPRLRYFIGDVRDLSRLRRALVGVDDVVHAAALKQVDSCEYNPLEAVKTNVYGTENVIEAALDRGVKRVLFISSDKAVDPVNLYGATKQVAERLVIDANVYGETMFSCTRYGNVISSRGSVTNRFREQRDHDEQLTVTSPSMTRFVLTVEQGVEFVSKSLARMRGGEVFVPMLPAVTLQTIVEAFNHPWRIIGTRPGEKLHEVLVSRHEGDRTERHDDHYVVQPVTWEGTGSGFPLVYSSEHAKMLTAEEFKKLAGLR